MSEATAKEAAAVAVAKKMCDGRPCGNASWCDCRTAALTAIRAYKKAMTA